MIEKKLCQNPACQQENGVNSKFCLKCGHKFTQSTQHVSQKELLQKNISSIKALVKEIKVPSFINRKILILTGAIVALVLITVIVLGMTSSNKSEILDTLERVTVSGDVDNLYDIFTIDEVTELEEQVYKDYLENNDVGLTANSLVEAIEYLHESDQALVYASSQYSYADEFKVTMTKKLGIFKSYEIQPIKYEVTAVANEDDIELVFDEQDISLSTDSEIVIGEYLPGKYPYTLFWENLLGSTKEEREVYVAPTELNELDGRVSYYKVALENDEFPELDYYINGEKKDTTNYVEDGMLLVPEGADFELTASFEEDGVLYESETLLIDGSSYYTFEFPKYNENIQAESAKQNAYKYIDSLINSYLSIYTSGDIGNLSTVISEDAPFLKEQTKYLQGLIEKDIQLAINHFEILNMTEIRTGSYTVSVRESYTIQKPNKSAEEMIQESIYGVDIIDGVFYITSLKLANN
ncbi:hypothetical protein IEO70_10750 [Bacillus sp. AGMB 02131]|uniref:TcaA protein NTF2-like domain-containing protein n=1 Tax=Peribacillus faecalis TaxID=2772559 RepID=A0A927CW22_9BACI|nr:hypothetical protein [Peribacillus faecalis]MBD3108843.1 hypothetical protein [Peribacillus faecalis]